MTAVLEADHLWKVYETGPLRIEALRDLSLRVAEGQMVAVMGPSGCGKTTLLNCLGGLDEVTSGDVRVVGTSVPLLSDAAKTSLRAERVGFIFQSFNLLPVLSALENVELPLLLQGIGPREARRRAREALVLVGLGEWAAHRPAELSGGQQQRVTVARAFVHEPSVILADEPTGNLDSATSGEVMDLLVQLNAERGITMLIVTHDAAVASRCSRLIVMGDGLVAVDGPVQAVFEHLGIHVAGDRNVRPAGDGGRRVNEDSDLEHAEFPAEMVTLGVDGAVAALDEAA